MHIANKKLKKKKKKEILSQTVILTNVSCLISKQINITLKEELPVQIDGEPWVQPPCQVIIRPTLHQVGQNSTSSYEIRHVVYLSVVKEN